jgi:hypothetical protein
MRAFVGHRTLAWWFELYNNRSPHKTFDYRKPMEIYQQGKLGGTPSDLPQNGSVDHETTHLNFAVDWSEEVNPPLWSCCGSGQRKARWPQAEA